jgi:aryl-alcohol dehydrogenase-like predicted oxidoreductase
MARKTDSLTRREFVRQVGLGAAALAAATTMPVELAGASTIKNGMGYRTLGRTGLEISEVGMGAGSISPSGENLIRAALSQGINFIETSSNYRNAQAETAIGQVVKSMGIRDRVYILSKAGNIRMERLLTAPASEVEKTIREELESSLKRLQTEYLDVYLCPYQTKSPQEAVFPAVHEALEQFKKEGKIRFTGLSTHSDYDDICMAAIDGGYYDTLMFPVNFATLVPYIREAVLEARKDSKAERGPERPERPILDVNEVLKAAQRKNIGVVAMKGAQEGFLPAAIRGRVKGEFAKDSRLSFHQCAYRYVLDQPQVSTVSIRMANMLHLEEALVLSQKTLKG